MADVIGFKGRFVSIDNTRNSCDYKSDVRLHANKATSSSDGFHLAKNCRLSDCKPTADETTDPGYVMKASVSGRSLRVFVNVCKKESVERPLAAKQDAGGGRFGLSWTIPHVLTEQAVNGSRDTQTCRIFDFQVHPDTCRMAETNGRFKSLLNELAIAAVAEEFDVHMNVKKLQFPKIKYKGATGNNTRKGIPLRSSVAPAKKSDNMKGVKCSNPKNIHLSSDGMHTDQQKSELHAVDSTDAFTDTNNNKFTVPSYTVSCSTNEEVPVVVNGVMFSQTLIANIELPLLTSALGINLDVFEQKLSLKITEPARYKLDVDLPHVIDENHSFAKFIKARKVLQITMPVISSSSHVSPRESVSDPSDRLVSESELSVEHSPRLVSADISACRPTVTPVTAEDVEDVNLDKDCQGETESVFLSVDVDSHVPDAFLGKDSETDKQFLASILLKDLDAQDTESAEQKSAALVSQNSVDGKTRSLKESKQSDEDVSSEFVVVHEKGIPKLHGILKQRTMSESSDDFMRVTDRQLCTATGSETDDSPDRSTASTDASVRVLKKSVSFNERIDHTLFQVNQSVSSMHAALKNRRRRARKRDQRQEQMQQRRRRRSSGSFSMEESGDERAPGTPGVRVRPVKDAKQSPPITCGPDLCSSHAVADKDDRCDSYCISDCPAGEEASTSEDLPCSELSSGIESASDSSLSPPHLSNKSFEPASDSFAADGNIAELLESCERESVGDAVKFACDSDSTVSTGEGLSQSPEITVPFICSQFHLDVD